MKIVTLCVALTLLTSIGASVNAAPSGSSTAGATATTKSQKAKPYPLTTCLVSDDELGKKPYTFVYQGQEIKLCCKDCRASFKKDPAKYMKKLDDLEKAQGKAN